MLAVAPNRQTLLNRAVSRVDAYNDGSPLYIVAAALATIAGPWPPYAIEILDARCRLDDFVSNKYFHKLYCDAMRANAGDDAALERLVQTVRTKSQRAESDSLTPADRAASVLLFDTGYAGHDRLRQLAMDDDVSIAVVALAKLCQLGPDAGSKVIARASALASETQDPRMRWISDTCAAPYRSSSGQFVDLQ
jgi:hypothetical protein